MCCILQVHEFKLIILLGTLWPIKFYSEATGQEETEGSIIMNKASGGDGITVELFQILEDDAVKVL